MTFNTSAIDAIPSAAAIRTSWAEAARGISDFATVTTDVKSTWSALGTQVKVSGTLADLYAAMDEPSRIASETWTSATTVDKAIQEFATTIETLVGLRVKVHESIAAWHRKHPSGVEEYFDENDLDSKMYIKARISGIAIAYAKAENTAIAAISPEAAKTGASAVPVYFPNGGAAWERQRAIELANRITSGTSPNVESDYREFLTILGGMTPEEIAALNREYPQIVTFLPPTGTDPHANRTWWNELTDPQKTALKTHASSLVGNMEGLTYADRKDANQNTLNEMLRRLEEQRNGTRDWGITGEQASAYEAMRNLQNEYRGGAKGGPGTDVGLLSFNPNNKPLAAFVLGDLDNASHQSWYIPGMTSSVERAGGLFSDAYNIWRAQQGELAPGQSNSMIAWVGYDAPPMIDLFGNKDVLDSSRAEAGGANLRWALEGLNASNSYRPGPAPYMSVTAHSYGTTTAAYGLRDINFKVDSVVFWGSAGIDPDAAKVATDLQIKEDPTTGRVALYAATADLDYVARGGILGSGLNGDPRFSPTNGTFGSSVFSVEGNGEVEGTRTKGHDGQGSGGYTPIRAPAGGGYVDVGTQSLNAIAKLSTGNSGEVPLWTESTRDEADEWIANPDGPPIHIDDDGPRVLIPRK